MRKGERERKKKRERERKRETTTDNRLQTTTASITNYYNDSNCNTTITSIIATNKFSYIPRVTQMM